MEKLSLKQWLTLTGSIDAGPHMTTSVVARDIISILDAYAMSPEGSSVTDPHLLNFWGFSYGTIIGQTFGSMFPDRVGRVVLDGVVDPDDYSRGKIRTWLQDTDAAFSTFFIYCSMAGPDLCSYHTGSTAQDIFDRFDSIISRLDVDYATEQQWANATLLDIALEGVKLLSFQATYAPFDSFTGLSKVLVNLEDAMEDLTEESLAPFKALVEGKDNGSDDPDGMPISFINLELETWNKKMKIREGNEFLSSAQASTLLVISVLIFIRKGCQFFDFSERCCMLR